MSTRPDTKTPRSRSEVRRDYGHPWPWHSKELLAREYVENDRSTSDLAEDWLCSTEAISRAANRFGLSKEADR